MAHSRFTLVRRGKGAMQVTSNFGSTFREASACMANAIADKMGDCVTITPMTAVPNFAPEPDPARQAINVTAVYTHKPVYAFNDKRDYRTSGNTEMQMAPLITTASPKFCIRLCELPWPIRRMDRITLLRTDEVYEVTEAQPDSIGNMLDVSVVQLGKRYQFETTPAKRFAGVA